MFGHEGHDRPAPGDPIGGWCEQCGAAYAVAATRCPECHAPVAYVAPTPSLTTAPADTLDVDGEPIGGWCPRCGDEFALGVQVCPDCGVELTHQPPASDDVLVTTLPTPERDRHDIVEYDLTDWDAHQRRELTRQLEVEHIVHEWQGGVLHVPGAHEASVDELVDVLDGAFDEDADLVDYEVPAWTMEQCDELVRRMQDLGTPFEWDGLTLTVPSSAEATVDAVVRAIDPSFPT